MGRQALSHSHSHPLLRLSFCFSVSAKWHLKFICVEALSPDRTAIVHLECGSAFNLCTGGQHFQHPTATETATNATVTPTGYRHTHINIDTDIGLLFGGGARAPRPQKCLGISVSLPVSIHPSMKLCVQLYSNYRTLIYLTCCLTSSSSSNGGRPHGRGSCCPFKCVHPFKSLISFWHFALAFGISLILLKSCQCHAHSHHCWPLATPTLVLFIYLFIFVFRFVSHSFRLDKISAAIQN